MNRREVLERYELKPERIRQVLDAHLTTALFWNFIRVAEYFHSWEFAWKCTVSLKADPHQPKV